MKLPRILLLLLLSIYTLSKPALVPVTNTNPSGPGSLDNAINIAAPGDTIVFQLVGTGPFIITLAAGLPVINKPLFIDGYSQAGSAFANGLTPATIMIEIQAPNVVGSIFRFIAGSDGSLLRGVAINSATYASAINIQANSIQIAGNHLGMNAQGTISMPNMVNVNTFLTNNVLIGGFTSAERNVIAGVNQSLLASPINSASGSNVGILVSNNTAIVGNYIGTNPSGNAALGVSEVGVFLSNNTNNTLIENNLISGNTMTGITLGVTSTTAGIANFNTLIQDNYIGTDVLGSFEIPNGFGICINANASNTLITNNIISGNESDGIQIGTFIPNQFFNTLPVQGPTVITLNKIGTDAQGRFAIPNNGYGIAINQASSNTIIGGEGEANIISGNTLDGVSISSQASNNIVIANKIGVNVTATEALGNKSAGVFIGGLAKGASNNTIGVS